MNKITISIDTLLLERIDQVANELQVARSHLLLRATEEFLERYDSKRILAALDRAHADGPTAEEIEGGRAAKRGHRRRVEALQRWIVPG